MLQRTNLNVTRNNTVSSTTTESHDSSTFTKNYPKVRGEDKGNQPLVRQYSNCLKREQMCLNPSLGLFLGYFVCFKLFPGLSRVSVSLVPFQWPIYLCVPNLGAIHKHVVRKTVEGLYHGGWGTRLEFFLPNSALIPLIWTDNSAQNQLSVVGKQDIIKVL